MCPHLHGEPQLLDAFLPISGPGCRLIIIPLEEVPPHQESRLPRLRPVFHHLGDMKTKVMTEMIPNDADVWPI